MKMENIHVGQLSDIGRVRKVNQDSIGEMQLDETNGEALFMVCDGMGGHKAGEVASQLVVKTIKEKLDKSLLKENPQEALKKVISEAHQAIINYAKEDLEASDLGTTAVVAYIKGEDVTIANVGDSRAYIFYNDKFEQITEDHSQVAQMLRMGLITPEEAKIGRKNILVRSLSANTQSAEVDIFTRNILAGNSILLCSDGLWGQVEDDKISEILKQYSPQEACEELVRLANKSGGPDNISVIIVHRGDISKGLGAKKNALDTFLFLLLSALILSGIIILAKFLLHL